MQDAFDIWLLDETRVTRFTVHPDNEFVPVWAPDNSRIVYAATARPIGLYQKLTNGAGAEEPLLSTGHVLVPTSWSHDGRLLMFTSSAPDTGADLWVLPMAGNRKPFLFLKTPFRESEGSFSPDGRWVAYQSNASGRAEVYVRPFDQAAGGEWQISSAGGIDPVWRADGKELYFLSPNGELMAASLTVSGQIVQPGVPVLLFPTRVVGAGSESHGGGHYDVTRDGRFLINTQLDEAPAPITLLQNWNPSARK